MLRLHDTATGTVRPVALREPGRISLYVCGPTVYEVPHLGHGRFSLAFDVLRRYLVFRGLDVRYVSNVTDIDDKIIARAAAEARSEAEVAGQFEEAWWRAMERLDVLRPELTPHATAYVEDMVELVGRLVANGSAYETPDGVYLAVQEVPGYGLLARQTLDSLRAGARVDVDEEKRSPLDFALWKKAKPQEPSWPSPWGPGRPGWHTECVVMSLDLLGERFDLHGGGIDLAFPHHENERAQAVADGKEFARHWVHCGFVTVEGEKMSKSLGNFTTLEDLLARSDARAYRLLVLRSHYRRPIEITPPTVADAEQGLARLDALAARFDLSDPLSDRPFAVADRDRFDGIDDGAVGAFLERMDDDLDTPGALGGIFELVRRAHGAADRGEQDRSRLMARTASLLAAALGLRLRSGTGEVDEDARALAHRRDEARAARDWPSADRLREQLIDRGWTVEDGPEGTRLRRG